MKAEKVQTPALSALLDRNTPNANQEPFDAPALSGVDANQEAKELANTLPILVQRINETNRQANDSAKKAIFYALECGAALTEAKAQVKHGEWQGWLKNNCEVSERTAQNYMKLAKEYPLLEDSKAQRVADLSIREAVKLLSAPKEMAENDDDVSRDYCVKFIEEALDALDKCLLDAISESKIDHSIIERRIEILTDCEKMARGIRMKSCIEMGMVDNDQQYLSGRLVSANDAMAIYARRVFLAQQVFNKARDLKQYLNGGVL